MFGKELVNMPRVVVDGCPIQPSLLLQKDTISVVDVLTGCGDGFLRRHHCNIAAEAELTTVIQIVHYGEPAGRFWCN